MILSSIKNADSNDGKLTLCSTQIRAPGMREGKGAVVESRLYVCSIVDSIAGNTEVQRVQVKTSEEGFGVRDHWGGEVSYTIRKMWGCEGGRGRDEVGLYNAAELDSIQYMAEVG